MSNLKQAANRLNNRSDNRSVELTVNRSGIPVEIYLAHLELVANGGINELDSVLTESVTANYISQESADATVSRVEQPMLEEQQSHMPNDYEKAFYDHFGGSVNELCDGLFGSYIKGKTNA